jgi:hypothetical protein
MSFYAVAKCMLSGRGSLRRASAWGRKEGFVSSGVVSGDEREQVKRSQRSSGDGLDRQDGHLLCSSIACAVYGGTLARWMTPGLGFCRGIKFQGKEGYLGLRRLENMNIHGDCETIQQHRLRSFGSLWAVATMPYAPHLFHGI